MKRWKIGVVGIIAGVTMGSITSYAGSNNEGYEYIGKSYTIQSFPYQYKESIENIEIYEEMKEIDAESLLLLKEETKLFSSNAYLVKTVKQSQADYYYYGEMKNDKPDGSGVLLKKWGEAYIPYYIGEFSKGYRAGYEIEYQYAMQLEDVEPFYQVIYEGKYKDGKRNGKGCEYYTALDALQKIVDRSIEVGFSMEDTSEFEKNAAEAMELVQQTELAYKSVDEKGAFFSEYPLVYVSKNKEGNWKNGELEGQSIVYEVGNYVYAEGTFKSGVPNGKVKLLYPYMDRISYTGNMKNGEFDGKGTLYYETGQIKYKGDFKNGQYSGNGTLYNEDGSIVHKGKFKNGDVSS